VISELDKFVFKGPHVDRDVDDLISAITIGRKGGLAR
jgi:hypothetical protein